MRHPSVWQTKKYNLSLILTPFKKGEEKEEGKGGRDEPDHHKGGEGGGQASSSARATQPHTPTLRHNNMHAS